MRCSNYVESQSQYYNPKTGTKGGRIVVVSNDVCAICDVQDDIVSPDEMFWNLILAARLRCQF